MQQQCQLLHVTGQNQCSSIICTLSHGIAKSEIKPATHASQAMSSGSQMGSQGHCRVRKPASILLHTLAAHLSDGYHDLQKEMPLVYQLLCCTKCCFVGTHDQQLWRNQKSYPRYLTSYMSVLMTRAENNVLLTQQAFGYFTPTSAPLCKMTVILLLAVYHTEISNPP